MHPIRRIAWLLVPMGLLLAPPPLAPASPGPPERATDPAPPPLPRPLPGRDGAEQAGAPSTESSEKQLERAKRQASDRRATREARARDARRELARSMRRWLRGGPITPEVREELHSHARRTARLLRIAELAALDGDLDTVKRAERLLGRDRSRHERWLRELGRPPRPEPATPPSATAEANPGAEPSTEASAQPTALP